MAEPAKYIERGPVVAYSMEPDEPPMMMDYKVIDGWKEEAPVEEWTEWTPWELVSEEKTGAMRPIHNRDGGLFRAPSIALIVPEEKRVYKRHRKLVRRWVDKYEGPMVEIIDIEKDIDVRVS